MNVDNLLEDQSCVDIHDTIFLKIILFHVKRQNIRYWIKENCIEQVQIVYRTMIYESIKLFPFS